MSIKPNFIALTDKSNNIIYLNLDNVLMFKHINVKCRDDILKVTKTYVRAYILQGTGEGGDYDIIEITELDRDNYKKIKKYLLDP